MSTHVVVLDGWQHRRAAVHWQGWLAEQLVDRGHTVDYVTLPEPDRPRRDRWRDALLAAVDGRAESLVVAHGLSVLHWLWLADEPHRGPIARRALLVAPPEPGRIGGSADEPLPPSIGPAEVRALTVEPSLLAFAHDDPYCPAGADVVYGQPLGLSVVVVGDGGHLNAASGFGPWPAALTWCLDGAWPAVAAPRSIAEALDRSFRPDGFRLGMIVLPGTPARVVGEVEAALRHHGLDPARRLARVGATSSRHAWTESDTVDFVERYGHEYGVVVGPARALAAGGRARVACEAADCAVVAVER